MLKSATGSASVLGSASTLGNLQHITNCCQLNWNNSATGTYTRWENRHFNNVLVDCFDLHVGYPGFYIKQDGTGEAVVGNDFTAQSAIELASPVMFGQPYFGGASASTSGVVPNGAPLVISDMGAPLFIAGQTQVNMRTGYTIASTALNIPSTSGSKIIRYSSGYQSTASSSEVPATGAMTDPGAPSNGVSGVPPYLVLGRPKSPICSAVWIGDSITVGQGETPSTYDSFNTAGWIGRGLNLYNPYPMPWLCQGAPSNKLSAELANTGWRKRAAWPYFTHLIIGVGSNDIAAGVSLNTMQTNATALLTAAKGIIGPYGKPLKTYWALIVPRTTSSNSFVDAAGQTPVAGYTAGGVRDQFNSYLRSIAGGTLLDGIIDVTTPVQDPNNANVWITTGAANYPTSDGTHPSTALNIIMGQVLTPIAQAWTP